MRLWFPYAHKLYMLGHSNMNSLIDIKRVFEDHDKYPNTEKITVVHCGVETSYE